MAVVLYLFYRCLPLNGNFLGMNKMLVNLTDFNGQV